MLAFAGPTLAASAAAAQSAGARTRLDLTPPVLQMLHQMQDQAVQLLVQTDPDRAAARVSDLLESVHQVGLARLPDLARAARVRAVDRARNEDFDLANQALAAAELLDPERPANSFAAASVSRLEGRYLASWGWTLRGFVRTFRWPFGRYLLLEGALLWFLWVLLVAAGLFVAVQMATKGGALVKDLAARLGGRLPAAVAFALSLVLLLWPLALPSGFAWLILYWSILLWGYGSASERVVLICAWLLLGAVPVLLAQQRQRLDVALSQPAMALGSLEGGELYGDLFNDLGLLRELLPESVAVRQLVADVHRRLGQWDLARANYQAVVKEEPGNSAVLIDLGAYYFFRRDYAQAIEQFKAAAEVDPGSAVAQYDLSQAYRESYRFEEADLADQRARGIDQQRVESWVQGSERVVAVGGGILRAGEIRRELAARLRATSSATREGTLDRFAPIALALGPLILAVVLHSLRRRRGYTEAPLDLKLGSRAGHRWLRVFLPGFPSAEVGDGGRGFFALLAPLVLASIPFASRLGYRIPWGYEPGPGAGWIVALVGLAAYFAARYRWDLAHEV
ncbi:MAG TPA: hypothetical protein VN783_11670 [Thermoanaerobaculia bacterium]|nr:hypothetical protein [Thermoanaerobaculia bacterium]